MHSSFVHQSRKNSIKLASFCLIAYVNLLILRRLFDSSDIWKKKWSTCLLFPRVVTLALCEYPTFIIFIFIHYILPKCRGLCPNYSFIYNIFIIAQPCRYLVSRTGTVNAIVFFGQEMPGHGACRVKCEPSSDDEDSNSQIGHSYLYNQVPN